MTSWRLDTAVETPQITAGHAYGRLRTQSQKTNTALRDVAATLLTRSPAILIPPGGRSPTPPWGLPRR